MFIYWASKSVFRHGEGMLQSLVIEMYIIFIFYLYLESGDVLARIEVIFASIWRMSRVESWGVNFWWYCFFCCEMLSFHDIHMLVGWKLEILMNNLILLLFTFWGSSLAQVDKQFDYDVLGNFYSVSLSYASCERRKGPFSVLSKDTNLSRNPCSFPLFFSL